ncbi:hypothetical protein ACN2XU_02785, partial [Primorskyibacter sp. 2E107]|uniref:hypothetical protein n=1 Tax=Primorskyibacter sp. 2E107 TaxID=3403458 RepID=UPI003AF62E45
GMAGPMVLFDNCFVIGQHKYFNASGSQDYEHNARYAQCQMDHAAPDDFLIFDRASGVLGGTWLVELDRCRSTGANSNNGEIVVWDAVFGARYAMNSHFGKRSFVFRDTGGRGTPLATGTFAATLPAGALVTRVTFRNAGLLSSTQSADFVVEDGAGTVIAGTSGVPPLNVAWSIDLPTCYVVPAGNERLVLRNRQGDVVQQGSTLFVEVEFIA